LDSIGAAEMEREVQKQVLTVAKKTSVGRLNILSGSTNCVKYDSQTANPSKDNNQKNWGSSVLSTNNGVTPSSYDLIILVSKTIKRFLERTRTLVHESILANFHTQHWFCNLSMTNNA
jgi:hypothetical protein